MCNKKSFQERPKLFYFKCVLHHSKFVAQNTKTIKIYKYVNIKIMLENNLIVPIKIIANINN